MKKIFDTEKILKSADYHKIMHQFVKWDYRKLVLFCFDIGIFLTVVIFFSLGELNHHVSQVVIKVIKLIILTGSFYILIKFTVTNFFYPNTYFKKIVLYQKAITIKNVPIKFKKEINYASILFLVYFVITNIIITIILNEESKELFQNQKIITALIATSSSLLLIPSFVASLGTIYSTKKKSYSSYKILIRNQFLANRDLFDDYEPINNFEQIKLIKLDVCNRRGILLLNNYEEEDTKQQVTTYNQELIAIYHQLWKHYCNYLFLLYQEKPTIIQHHHSTRLQLIFDTVFIDWFDF